MIDDELNVGMISNDAARSLHLIVRHVHVEGKIVFLQ